MCQVDLMGFKGLLLAFVMVLTAVAGCEEEVLQSCGDRQEICTSYCDLSIECMKYYDPECVTNCLALVHEMPISWLKVCVDNAKALFDKATTREEMDLACPIAFSESGLDECLVVETLRSSFSCTDAHTVTVCAEDGCCVVWDCVEKCGLGATEARCELQDGGFAGCACAMP